MTKHNLLKCLFFLMKGASEIMDTCIYERLCDISRQLDLMITESAKSDVSAIKNAVPKIYAHIMKTIFVKNVDFRGAWGGTVYTQYQNIAKINNMHNWETVMNDNKAMDKIKSDAIKEFKKDCNLYKNGMYEEVVEMFPDISKFRDLDYILDTLMSYAVKTGNDKLVGFLEIKDKEWERLN